MNESSILYENGPFWVCTSSRGKNYGFEVFKAGITHSVRVATIGFIGDRGLQRAKQEADRRAAETVA